MHENISGTFTKEQSSTDNCPSCQAEIVPKQKECYSCGIVFDNYRNLQYERGLRENVGGIDHLSLENLKTLETAWKKVVVNYHDKDAHGQFLKDCTRQNAIPYAVYCYTRMLEIDTDDDIASIMRNQALSLLATHFDKVPDMEAPIEPKDSIPVFKWIIWSGLFFSSALIAVGVFTPQAQNLTGLGVSLLFMFLVIYFYRLRNFL